ncbi:MAG: 16S rRNA (cytosine(1402)-N(4))-methyltransferase RsmH [Candidatus Brocadiae bacterium]|nr:16S rRNA (cytosine(1402)-N(4))-methyltransferase RsmH [Candidatus Brocadiia bacterium]
MGDHEPVLVAEFLALAEPKPGESWVDGTVGGGGHAGAILGRIGPAGRLIGIDRDPAAVETARARLASSANAQVERGSYERAGEVVRRHWGGDAVDGILLDLGVSSFQLDDPGRGFSFMRPGPLDMRMGPDAPETAAQLVNRLGVEELEAAIREFGEEPRARRVAEAIVRERGTRPIEDTVRFAELVGSAAGGRRGRAHPATRTFQAIRMLVNREVERLEAALASLPGLLRPGGRMAVITFHSLEDRPVKAAFRKLSRQDGWDLLTKHVVAPSREEVLRNPRSRSAKLRVIRRPDGERT